MREQRKNAAQGIFFKPEVKKSVGGSVAVALVAAFFLVMLLSAIYTAWPN